MLEDLTKNWAALQKSNMQEDATMEFNGYGYMRRMYGLENMPEFETIAKVSRTDPVTKAMSRVAFEEFANNETSLAKRYKVDLCGILICVNNYEEINEENGFLVSDNVLRETADIIKSSIRTTDLFFRWIADEFLVLTSHTDVEGAIIASQKIDEKIESHKYDYVEKVDIKLGITQFKTDDSLITFTKRMENALEEAKKINELLVVK